MSALVVGMEKSPLLGSYRATLSIDGDSMVVSFEDEDTSVGPGEVAHEEDGLAEEANNESISADEFIDNIRVFSDITRPTINVRYNHNINDGSSSFIIENAGQDSEQDSGGLPENEEEFEEATGFTIEFIEEVAEENEDGGANAMVSAVIQGILEGFTRIPPVSNFELVTPWQTVGSRHLGPNMAFLNPDNFYQFAETDPRMDVEELLNLATQYQFNVVKEEYFDYVKQNSELFDKFVIKENVSVLDKFNDKVVDSVVSVVTQGKMETSGVQTLDKNMELSDKIEIMKAASIISMKSYL